MIINEPTFEPSTPGNAETSSSTTKRLIAGSSNAGTSLKRFLPIKKTAAIKIPRLNQAVSQASIENLNELSNGSVQRFVVKIIGFITAPQTNQFKVVLQDYSSSIELVFEATYCIPVKNFFKVGAFHMIKKCFVVKKVSNGYYTATSHDYYIAVDKSFNFDDYPKVSPEEQAD